MLSVHIEVAPIKVAHIATPTVTEATDTVAHIATHTLAPESPSVSAQAADIAIKRSRERNLRIRKSLTSVGLLSFREKRDQKVPFS